ncbi:glycosyltransferase family 2 protein [Bythopirellula goksoeyrii]|uniref:Undecaprenyl-phosphate mannosyltransferase n=1 Tax=Bythopirellula goksoeyrii TaxID=1400387 RepID=A0A5B9Q8A6_9BACT|nr:glycosyltransferase family 2 protein [Bythopirellula goksoeyrii]QEG35294.1 Undecaprenyl-phosphate mannosyltransferase [Bythopirellula goksoeyrii]
MIQIADSHSVNCTSCRFLTALPVFNEANHVTAVLDEVVKYATDVLVVDDGSTDGTREILQDRDDIQLLVHRENQGYGAALKSAFDYAIHHRYDFVVTIDCDGQHEPQRITQIAAACRNADIVSGSRYLESTTSTDQVPSDRLLINRTITKELNQQLGLNLTDAFCGFKAYRTRALANLELTETGYAMPLELWVQAAWHGLRITEVPVPLIYLDEERSFGGPLDAAETRLNYYREVIAQAKDTATASGSNATAKQAKPCILQKCS